MEERPLRPAGAATLRVFAGLDPATGLEDGDVSSEVEEFLRNQAFEDALLGLTPDELNTMDVDGVIERVREVEEQDGDADSTSQHLSAVELQNLPSHAAPDFETAAECSVCLAAISPGQDIVRLPCGHLYHHTCIVRWLARSRHCPFCRASAVEPSNGRESADARGEEGGGGGGAAGGVDLIQELGSNWTLGVL